MAHQLPALVVHAVLDADENMAGGVLGWAREIWGCV